MYEDLDDSVMMTLDTIVSDDDVCDSEAEFDSVCGVLALGVDSTVPVACVLVGVALVLVCEAVDDEELVVLTCSVDSPTLLDAEVIGDAFPVPEEGSDVEVDDDEDDEDETVAESDSKLPAATKLLPDTVLGCATELVVAAAFDVEGEVEATVAEEETAGLVSVKEDE